MARDDFAKLETTYDHWHAAGCDGLLDMSDQDTMAFVADLKQRVQEARETGNDQAAAIGCYACIGVLRCLFDLRERQTNSD
jgi:hypothetical protein